jgi:hypothetical protein
MALGPERASEKRNDSSEFDEKTASASNTWPEWLRSALKDGSIAANPPD